MCQIQDRDHNFLSTEETEEAGKHVMLGPVTQRAWFPGVLPGSGWTWSTGASQPQGHSDLSFIKGCDYVRLKLVIKVTLKCSQVW